MYEYLRGKVLDVFSNYRKDAEDHLSKVVRLNPSLGDAWLSLGNCMWKKGDLSKAKNCYMLALISKENALPRIAGFAQNLYPLPATFLGPKCALWDCPRPATSQDYCNSHHAHIVPTKGYPGMALVLRLGGIGLKDNLLFAALCAKSHGKEVGVPKCEGLLLQSSLGMHLSFLTLLFWKDKQSGSGFSLISLEELLKVDIESKGHCQITMDVASMSLETKW